MTQLCRTVRRPPAVAGRYGYTGREFDAEAQLLYYRARYYDPAHGRFTSQDPLGLGPDVNPRANALQITQNKLLINSTATV